MDYQKLLDDIDSAIRSLNKAKKSITDEIQPKLFQLDEQDKPPDKAFSEEKLASDVEKASLKVIQYEFDAFHSFYKDTKFIWSPKENKAIKEIVKKIKITLKTAEISFTVENVRTSFQLLVKDIKEVDDFTYKNFSPSMINSRFNTIIANLKNLKKSDYSEELKSKLSDESWIDK